VAGRPERSIGTARCSRSPRICGTSPASTERGPTSTNTRAPSPYIVSISRTNSTGRIRCSESSCAIAVACGGPGSALLADARRIAPGGAIVVGGEVDSSELLVGRGRVAGADAAYVCRGRVCDLPVTTVEALAAALDAPR